MSNQINQNNVSQTIQNMNAAYLSNGEKTEDLNKIKEEIADLKKQLNDGYSKSESMNTGIYNRTSSQEVDKHPDDETKKQALTTGIKSAFSAAAGVAAGYVIGEIEKNMNEGKNTSEASPLKTPEKPKPEASLKGSIYHNYNLYHKSFRPGEKAVNLIKNHPVITRTAIGALDIGAGLSVVMPALQVPYNVPCAAILGTVHGLYGLAEVGTGHTWKGIGDFFIGLGLTGINLAGWASVPMIATGAVISALASME